ncbi:MAG TPA: formyltransferase family protein [Thermoanaerobaculia bacterium]|nr:formyltransferase family protein [Thermoanaerobaculia bacterium]
MRIALLVNQDLHANVALNLLLDTLAAHDVILFYSKKVGGKPPAVPELETLRALERDIPINVVWPLAEAAGRPTSAKYRTFPQIAEELGSSWEFMSNPNSPESLAHLHRFAPDLVVSIRYGGIFHESFLAIPRLGVLNLHSGLLPQFQGILLTLQALVADERTIGATLHWIIDRTIDSGPIVGVAEVPVVAYGSLFSHVQSLYPPGVQLLAEAIERLSRGESLASRPQDPTAASYKSFPEAPEFRALAERGFTLVDLGEYERLLRNWVPQL